MNATQAAINAGYSPKGAAVTGHKLLRKTKIAQLQAKKIEKSTKGYDTSIERILQECARIAFGDARKLFDADGRCKPITELDDDTAALIAGMKTVQKVTGEEDDGMVVFTDIKQADKLKALELLGKYRKMWSDAPKDPSLNVTIPLSLEINL